MFHGYDAAGIAGIAHVDAARARRRSATTTASIPSTSPRRWPCCARPTSPGPTRIALGSRGFTGVTETTEHGGYPVFEHLRQILGGPVVWAPAVDGAVVLSQRGGDFELTVGQDFSIGYSRHDATSVELYIEESLTFRINTPEAAVQLTEKRAKGK